MTLLGPPYTIPGGQVIMTPTVIGSRQTGKAFVKEGSNLQAEDYSAGISGWIIRGDGTVEFNDGTFRGALEAQSIDIPDDVTTESFHVDSDGDTWWGATTLGSAIASILKDGSASFSNIAITGGQFDLGSGVSSFHVDSSGNAWWGADLKANAKAVINADGTAEFQDVQFPDGGADFLLTSYDGTPDSWSGAQWYTRIMTFNGYISSRETRITAEGNDASPTAPRSRIRMFSVGDNAAATPPQDSHIIIEASKVTIGVGPDDSGNPTLGFGTMLGNDYIEFNDSSNHWDFYSDGALQFRIDAGGNLRAYGSTFTFHGDGSGHFIQVNDAGGTGSDFDFHLENAFMARIRYGNASNATFHLDRDAQTAPSHVAYSFIDDVDTGLERFAVNHAAIFAGGNAALVCTNSPAVAVKSGTGTGASTAYLESTTINGTTGWYAIRTTSSLRKHKDNIRPIDISIEDYMKLKPRMWESKCDMELGETFGGFVIEELPKDYLHRQESLQINGIVSANTKMIQEIMRHLEMV